MIYGLPTWAPAHVSLEQHVSFAITGGCPDLVLRSLLGTAGVAIAIVLVNTVSSPAAAIRLISLGVFVMFAVAGRLMAAGSLAINYNRTLA